MKRQERNEEREKGTVEERKEGGKKRLKIQFIWKQERRNEVNEGANLKDKGRK